MPADLSDAVPVPGQRLQRTEMEYRAIDWGRDHATLRGIDTGFVTDRIYSVSRAGLSFSLVEKASEARVVKRYEIHLTEEKLAGAIVGLAAYQEDHLVGIAVVRESSWNRRPELTDFYIDLPFRRRGLGRAMMDEVCRCLTTYPGRGLWTETQNVNLPAIDFYRRCGFELCGIDTTLYDQPHSAEVAVYLTRPIGRNATGGFPIPTSIPAGSRGEPTSGKS